MPYPRILVIDSYDSFTFNLSALLLKAIPSAKLYIIKNDALEFGTLSQFLAYFSAIIVGPGPGSPLNKSDVGVVKHIWHIASDLLVPIFGVCLGLQSLAVEHGAILKRLDVVKHGQVSSIYHHGNDLFEDVPNGCLAVRYHSLHIDLAKSTKLEELAWADDGCENGKIVMGIRHKFKPFWAVQYHPESICTDGNGLRVIKNFWTLASRWWATTRGSPRPWDSRSAEMFDRFVWPHWNSRNQEPACETKQSIRTHILPDLQLTSIQIAECLGVNKSRDDFVFLDSASDPGRYCIIGCLHEYSQRISYVAGDNYLTLHQRQSIDVPLGPNSFWDWISNFMGFFQHLFGNPAIPFWGGFVGFIGYELAVKELECKTLHRSDGDRKSSPDTSLVFVERSVILDSHTGVITIQSLSANDDDWFEHVASALTQMAKTDRQASLVKPLHAIKIEYPDRENYISRVKLAQEYLFRGETYELCLTARTRIQTDKGKDTTTQASWELYKRLREVNAAPYAAYMRLGQTTLVSSSPERFLSYSRFPNQKLQLRPIKGTVRKGEDISFDDAVRILRSPKEIGENLMIVDLIRHDLHNVIGQDVECKEFCSIEEYETLWQMVSVIEGRPQSTGTEESDMLLGWETLRQSLPPGSMTGAPKKRSVQILQELEDDERDLYSGVVGYWDVGGAGDWSVAIRSCFKHDRHDELEERESLDTRERAYDEWVLGAGGAITALSDPEAEWEEMMVKLKSVVRAFSQPVKDA